MAFVKPRVKVGVLIAAAAAVVAIGVVALKPSDKKPAAPNNTGSAAQTSNTTTENSAIPTVEVADYKYPKPTGWAKLSKEFLDTTAAESGIGYIGQQQIKFTVWATSAAPSSDSDLKNSTLEVLRKLPEFNLSSSVSIKVDNASGQKFTFLTVIDKTKTKKELSAITHNKKTYFLLSEAPDSSYASRQADFNTIVSGFKFK